MTTGYNYTGALADSLNSMVAAARTTHEYEGIMSQLVDKQNLEDGTGLTWNEVSLGQLNAQAVSETTKLDNPQQATDTNFPITPSIVGIHTVLTDRLKRRMAPKAYVKIGVLAQEAIERKLDEDLLVVLDGATTSLPGTGVTLSSGVIASMAVRITSNATEPGKGPIRCVLHGFQIRDIATELTASIGTYPVGDGETARVFRDGFRGRIGGADVYEDGNITIDATPDGKGGVFDKNAIVLVQGRPPWKETRREPDLGGGADSVWLYNEYAAGERSAGNWLYEVMSDCTAPTS